MKGDTWSAVVAGNAIALAGTAIGAAIALSRLALPKLAEELSGMGSQPPEWVSIALDHHNELPLVGVPGLVLGVAAMMIRPLRSVLAVAAIIAAGLAIAAILLMFIGTLAPLYNASAGL